MSLSITQNGKGYSWYGHWCEKKDNPYTPIRINDDGSKERVPYYVMLKKKGDVCPHCGFTLQIDA